MPPLISCKNLERVYLVSQFRVSSVTRTLHSRPVELFNFLRNEKAIDDATMFIPTLSLMILTHIAYVVKPDIPGSCRKPDHPFIIRPPFSSYNESFGDNPLSKSVESIKLFVFTPSGFEQVVLNESSKNEKYFRLIINLSKLKKPEEISVELIEYIIVIYAKHEKQDAFNFTSSDVYKKNRLTNHTNTRMMYFFLMSDDTQIIVRAKTKVEPKRDIDIELTGEPIDKDHHDDRCNDGSDRCRRIIAYVRRVQDRLREEEAKLLEDLRRSMERLRSLRNRIELDWKNRLLRVRFRA